LWRDEPGLLPALPADLEETGRDRLPCLEDDIGFDDVAGREADRVVEIEEGPDATGPVLEPDCLASER
jgi:hypothetical protein